METTEVVALRLPPDMVTALDGHAKNDRRSRANLLQVIVEGWLMDRAEAKVIAAVPTRHRQTAEEFIAGRVLVDPAGPEYDAEAS